MAGLLGGGLTGGRQFGVSGSGFRVWVWWAWVRSYYCPKTVIPEHISTDP